MNNKIKALEEKVIKQDARILMLEMKVTKTTNQNVESGNQTRSNDNSTNQEGWKNPKN